MKIIRRTVSIVIIIAVIFMNPTVAFAAGEILNGATTSSIENISSRTGEWAGVPYKYTGNIRTGNINLYDYISDEEMAGREPNSTASGYSDPFTAFNNRVSAIGFDENGLISPSSENLTIYYQDDNALIDDENIKVYLFGDNPGEHTDWDEGLMTLNRDVLYYAYTVNYESLGFTPTHFIIHGTDLMGNWQTNDIECDLTKGHAYVYSTLQVDRDNQHDDENEVRIRVNPDILRVILLDGGNYASQNLRLSGAVRLHMWDNGGSGEEKNVEMTLEDGYLTASVDIRDYTDTPMFIFQSSEYTDSNNGVHNAAQWCVESDAYALWFGNAFLLDPTANLDYTDGLALDIRGATNAFMSPLYFGCFYKGDNASDYCKTNRPDYVNFNWQTNMSHRTVSNASVQGLVDTDLLYGLPAQNGVALPYFDSSWADTNSDVMKAYTGLSFPFYEVEMNASDLTGDDTRTGKARFYQFNSKDLNVCYDSSDGGVLQESPTVIHSQSGNAGFFPFDSADDGSLNLGFGSKFSVSFKLNSDGTTSLYDDAGNPTGDTVNSLFEFIGGDDVWVYIDNKLVLDMGGVHSDARGVIDFGNKTATVYNAFDLSSSNCDNLDVTPTDKTVDLTQRVPGMFTQSEGNVIYNDRQEHELTVFFLERGMYDSDLFIRFNTAIIENNNTYEIREVTDYSDVNPGLLDATIYSGEKDIFSYSIENIQDSDPQNGSPSGIVNPITDTYTRNAGTDQAVLLSGFDTQKSIYLDTSSVSNYVTYSSQSYAWVYADDVNDGTICPAMYIDDSVPDLYSVTVPDNATHVRWFRSNNYYYSEYGSDMHTYPTVIDATPDYEFTSGDVFKISQDGEQGYAATVINNVNSSNDFICDNGNTIVSNVAYLWKDARATRTVTTDGNPLSGRTDIAGRLRLFQGYNGYNSSAEFRNQFQRGSTMTVTQNDTIETVKVDNGVPSYVDRKTDESGYSSRDAYSYYDTSHVITDAYNNRISNDSQGSFTYANLTGPQNAQTPVKVVEEFRNKVYTGDISVTKKVTIGDTSFDDRYNTRSFKFRIYIGDVFGEEGNVVTDYDSIVANKHITTKTRGDEVWGEFTLKNGETLVIEGVPAGTGYSVYEVVDDNDARYIDSIYYVKDNSDNWHTQAILPSPGNMLMSKKQINASGDAPFGPVSVTSNTICESESWFGYYTNVISRYNTHNDVTIKNIHDTGELKMSKYVDAADDFKFDGLPNNAAKQFDFAVNIVLPEGEGDLTDYYMSLQGKGEGRYGSVSLNDPDYIHSTIHSVVLTSNRCYFEFSMSESDGYKILTNIPLGASYTVTEIYDPSPDSSYLESRCFDPENSVTSFSGVLLHDNNSSTHGASVDLNFVNAYTEKGYISAKKVIDKDGSGNILTDGLATFTPPTGYDPTFNFSITLLDENDDPVNRTFPYTVDDGATGLPLSFGTITITDGHGVFSLKDGQYILIDKVPINYAYDIVETTLPYTTYIDDDTSVSHIEDYIVEYDRPSHPCVQSEFESVMAQAPPDLPSGYFIDDDVPVFHNRLDVQTLRLSKVIKAGVPNDSYNFSISVSDFPITGTINDCMTVHRAETDESSLSNMNITGTSKNLNVSLKTGDYVDLILPAGVSYSITEEGGTGYIASYVLNGAAPVAANDENESLSLLNRTLSSGQDDTVVFTNMLATPPFEPYVLPESGFEDRRLFMALMLAFMLVSTSGYMYASRRKEKTHV